MVCAPIKLCPGYEGFQTNSLLNKPYISTDEVYWLVIRFTTIGFGDEFRDITSTPAALPSLINTLLVSMILLPLGISIFSHLFYVWRKLTADRLRWVKEHAHVDNCTTGS